MELPGTASFFQAPSRFPKQDLPSPVASGQKFLGTLGLGGVEEDDSARFDLLQSMGSTSAPHVASFLVERSASSDSRCIQVPSHVLEWKPTAVPRVMAHVRREMGQVAWSPTGCLVCSPPKGRSTGPPTNFHFGPTWYVLRKMSHES